MRKQSQRWRSVVAIYRIIKDSAFDPEQVRRLTTAYELTLNALHVVSRNDPLTEVIAKKIIEIAQTNERDPERISMLVIQQLGRRAAG